MINDPMMAGRTQSCQINIYNENNPIEKDFQMGLMIRTRDQQKKRNCMMKKLAPELYSPINILKEKKKGWVYER